MTQELSDFSLTEIPDSAKRLNDFDEAIAWIKSKPATEQQMIEEAILGVVSSLDKPKSPSGEAKEAFSLELNEEMTNG